MKKLTKQYAITQPDGSLWDTGSLGALEDAAAAYVGAGMGHVVCVVGKTSKTCMEVYTHAQEKRAAWLERKEQTHKKVSVRHGSSAGSYVKKWFPKEAAISQALGGTA